MPAILQLISGILQIIYLVLKNKFERDAQVKKQKEVLHGEIQETIASRDSDRINNLILRMRQ